MKKQISLKLCLVFLLLSIFSMLVIGCRDNDATKANTEEVEGKQLMENNSTNTSKKSAVGFTAPEMNTSQTAPINDQIQMEQWRQLIGDIKSALGDIKRSAEQAR